MERPLEKASVVVLLLVGVAYAILPEQVGVLLAPGISAITAGLQWANANLPRPVFLVFVFLATAIVSILIAISFARVFYRFLSDAGPRVTYVYRKLTPGTPIGKIAVAFGVMVVFLVGTVWAIPYVVGDLGSSPALNNSTVDNQPVGEVLEDAERRALRVFEGDVVRSDVPDGGESYRRPTPDTDGDRLKDSWERAGVTPAGVRLPNANPRRMDLYVQINYGGGTIPLSQREKEQLRAVWAAMPIRNPDGSRGITLHIDDQRPRGGPLGRRAVYSGTGGIDTLLRFYTPRYLGQRMCRYHQVVVGEIRTERVGGSGSAPGYAAYVQSQRNEVYVEELEEHEFRREVSPRVHTITHELLHNVVGGVDGQAHTTEGWLAPVATPENAFLSDATAAEIRNDGFVGSGYYQSEVCGHGNGNTTESGA